MKAMIEMIIGLFVFHMAGFTCVTGFVNDEVRHNVI